MSEIEGTVVPPLRNPNRSEFVRNLYYAVLFFAPFVGLLAFSALIFVLCVIFRRHRNKESIRCENTEASWPSRYSNPIPITTWRSPISLRTTLTVVDSQRSGSLGTLHGNNGPFGFTQTSETHSTIPSDHFDSTNSTSNRFSVFTTLMAPPERSEETDFNDSPPAYRTKYYRLDPEDGPPSYPEAVVMLSLGNSD